MSAVYSSVITTFDEQPKQTYYFDVTLRLYTYIQTDYKFEFKQNYMQYDSKNDVQVDSKFDKDANKNVFAGDSLFIQKEMPVPSHEYDTYFSFV